MQIKLNLISGEKKSEIGESKKLKIILEWSLEIYLILAIFFFLLVSLSYVIKTNLNLISRNYGVKSEDYKYAELEQYETKLKAVNSRVLSLEAIQKNQLYWSKIFSKLDLILTPEVILNNFSNKNHVIFLVGKTKTRDDLVALKERLEKESCFSDVKLPLSNLVAKENVDFQIEFNVKDECLK